MSIELDVNCTLSGYWSLEVNAGDTKITLNDINPDKGLIPALVTALSDTLCFQNIGRSDLVEALTKIGLIEREDIKCYAEQTWEMGGNEY